MGNLETLTASPETALETKIVALRGLQRKAFKAIRERDREGYLLYTLAKTEILSRLPETLGPIPVSEQLTVLDLIELQKGAEEATMQIEIFNGVNNSSVLSPSLSPPIERIFNNFLSGNGKKAA